MNSVSIEPITYILRYHPDGEYGSPYTFVCNITMLDNIAHIRGAVGEMNRNIWRLINDKCKELGIKSVRFERIKPTTIVQHSPNTKF